MRDHPLAGERPPPYWEKGTLCMCRKGGDLLEGVKFATQSFCHGGRGCGGRAGGLCQKRNCFVFSTLRTYSVTRLLHRLQQAQRPVDLNALC